MRSYKEYSKIWLGKSDRAELAVEFLDSDAQSVRWGLPFGEDGSYSAYLCEEDAEIGEHYERLLSVPGRVVISDDTCTRAVIDAGQIEIWRAGGMGCIIRVSGLRGGLVRYSGLPWASEGTKILGECDA